MSEKVKIHLLKTGVPGLDNLLGGGLPEFSFNLIAGTPGSGKTTLAHQIMFSLAKPDNRAPVLHGTRRTTFEDASLSAAICVF